MGEIELKSKLSNFFVCIGILALCAFATGCPKGDVANEKDTTLNSELAVIDKSAIMKMSAFIKSNEKVAEAITALEKSYSEQMKKASPEEQKELYARFRQESTTVRNKELNSLMSRVAGAISVVAKEKNIKVVLDKSIVVTGAPDITEAVKDKFKSDENFSESAENIGSDSTVGYFDQSVIMALNLFRNADTMMQNELKAATEEFQKKAPSMNDEQKKEFIMNQEKRLEAKRGAIMTPLLNKVTTTVESVAKQKNLVLVLDKQYVMYGGRNITEDVVKDLQNSAQNSESTK